MLSTSYIHVNYMLIWARDRNPLLLNLATVQKGIQDNKGNMITI